MKQAKMVHIQSNMLVCMKASLNKETFLLKKSHINSYVSLLMNTNGPLKEMHYKGGCFLVSFTFLPIKMLC